MENMLVSIEGMPVSMRSLSLLTGNMFLPARNMPAAAAMAVTILAYLVIMLAIAIVLIAMFSVARGIGLKGVIKEGAGLNHTSEKSIEKRLRKDVRKYGGVLGSKLGFAEKIELYLVDKSNIRRYVPFMSARLLLMVCLSIFCTCSWLFYRLLRFMPSAVSLAAVASLIPVVILDLMGRYNSEKVRKKLAEFISVLNRWCAVKEDIFYAFEKSLDSGIGEPLSTFIRDMVIQVNRGIDPADALGILQMKVDNPQFKDFIVNIKQNIKHRGDLKTLLDNLEDQFYKIEEEFNRRKISTYRDRMIVYVIMLLVLFTGYFFLKINPAVEDFYLGTTMGKTLVALFCFLYIAGFYMIIRADKFKY